MRTNILVSSPRAGRLAVAALSMTLLGALGACSSDGSYKCPPNHGSCTEGSTIGDRLACPPGGLGVAVHEGVSVADQMAYFDSYACAEPQLCPDQGGTIGAYPVDPRTDPSEASFLLTNCSTGSKKLEIEKVVVYGDARCFFTEVTDRDIQDKVVNPGRATAIRTTYKPTEVGEDHAELRVYSNAENYPVLRIRVCSTAYIEQPEPELPIAPDGGLSDGAVPAADAYVPPRIECKAQEQRTDRCHKDPPIGSTPSGDAGAGGA